MRVAIAVTHESIVSLVATAYEVLDLCARTQCIDAVRSQVFAVSSETEQVFRQRFGFIELLDSRHTLPVDWVFVPALVVSFPRMPAKYLSLIRWLRRVADTGALITAVGTGSFLLAEAGILAGREAVTYSYYADDFAARYPEVRLRRDVTSIHEGSLLLTGDMPWQELVLAVICKNWGEQAARLAADTYALDWRQQLLPQDDQIMRLDPSIAAAQQWMTNHIKEPDVINRCVDELKLARRTFNRRFKQVTGITPLEFVQRTRLKIMRDLLLFTTRSIEDICYEIGYGDVATVYKLFRRRFGISPSKFRRQPN